MFKNLAARFRAQTSRGTVAADGSPRGTLSRTWLRIRPWLLNRYVVFVVFLLVLANILGRISGFSGLRSHVRTELPIVLLLYWALSFILKRRKIAPYIAALPLVIYYIGYDVCFIAWGNVFKVIDFQNLSELLKVLSMGAKMGLLLILALPIVLLLWCIDYRRYLRLAAVVTFAALLIVALERKPTTALAALDRVGFQVAEWSDAETVNENGRVAATLYFEAMRRKSFAETAMYRTRPDFDTAVRNTAAYLQKHGNRRNVYVVVMESFLDPTLFRGVEFSRDPRHPDFADLVKDQQGFSISPVFGGETAEAEFEVLCGVPALQRISEIEFDDFTGAPTGCMPGILAQAGYTTIVSNSFEPNYFNSTKAYTGIGFQEIYFPAEYGSASSTYLTARNVSNNEDYMFDGDLFDQNLGFIAKRLHDQPGRPYLSYVLGIYGHEPHEIDTDLRPLVLSYKSGDGGDQLLRAANQYWYRTQAIAHYIRELTKLDRKSIIVIVSDHLPPLDKGVNSYHELRYLDNVEDSTHMNRIIVVIDGKVVRQNTIHHYDVSSLVYDYLTKNKYCAEGNCTLSDKEREERYMSLMARAVASR